jgi:hypothetical protein
MVSFQPTSRNSAYNPSARLCHMLGLEKIDQEGGFSGKRLLNPAKDWIELEERRRALWASFYGDRWASSATGWPMMFDDKTVRSL